MVRGEPMTVGCRTRYWFEQRRATAPRWMPNHLAWWWTRWRRLSQVGEIRAQNGPAEAALRRKTQRRRLCGGRGPDGRLYVPLHDEDEMYRVLRQLDECGA